MTRSSCLQYIAALFMVIASFLPMSAEARIELLPQEEAWLAEHAHEVYFAPEKDYPPFIWEQYKTLFGISKDYLNYIQVELEVPFQERGARSLKEILEAVRNGEQSFVSSLGPTPQRSEYLLFTRPYFTSPALFVGKSGMSSISVPDIINKEMSVAIGEGYGAHDYLKERYPSMVFVLEENDFLVLEDLKNGKADIAVVDAASLAHLSAEHEMKNLKKIGETGFTYSLSFAVPKSLPHLRNILDAAIGNMPKSAVHEISKRWVSDPATLNSLAGSSVAFEAESGGGNQQETIIIMLSAFLMLLLGFVLHYLYVRITPRRDSAGHNEYIP